MIILFYNNPPINRQSLNQSVIVREKRENNWIIKVIVCGRRWWWNVLWFNNKYVKICAWDVRRRVLDKSCFISRANATGNNKKIPNNRNKGENKKK